MNQSRTYQIIITSIFKIELVLIIILFASTSFGQSVNLNDLSQFKAQLQKAPLYKINGNLSSSLMYTGGTNLGINQSILWTAAGNLDIIILNKIKVPLFLNLSTAGIGYKLPQSPSRFNFKPNYKWIKAYVGSSNMTFSPYTLNGHLFSGFGIELEPPKQHLKVAAMYGRLQRAVAYDSTNLNFRSATYERFGYGAKVEYQGNKYNIGMSVFSAKDKYASLVHKPDSIGVMPQQNLAVSYSLVLKPSKGLFLNSEFATSLFTSDIRTAFIKQSSFNNFRYFNYAYRSATQKNNAFKIQLGYNIKKTVIGFMVERVDPGFQSLGNYFMNNDLENFAFNMSRVFLKNKLTIATNFGTQQDNLKHTKASTSNRFLGALSVIYNPSEKVFNSFNYSSFKSYMYVQPQLQTLSQIALAQYQNLDTLNFKQVSENAVYNMNYIIKSSESIAKSLNLNINYQNASNIQTGSLMPSSTIETKYYNAALAYMYALKSLGLKFNMLYNLNISTQGGATNTVTNGPTIAGYYSILDKKLNIGATLSYNHTNMVQHNKSINTFINRLSADYKLKNNSIRFDIMLQSRKGKGLSTVNSIGNLTYNMSF
jgi:hypothetical protein